MFSLYFRDCVYFFRWSNIWASISVPLVLGDQRHILFTQKVNGTMSIVAVISFLDWIRFPFTSELLTAALNKITCLKVLSFFFSCNLGSPAFLLFSLFLQGLTLSGHDHTVRNEGASHNPCQTKLVMPSPTKRLSNMKRPTDSLQHPCEPL